MDGQKLVVPEDLIRRCQDGDLDAQAEIFYKTIDHVQRILYRLVGPSPDHEDLIQDTYFALWRAIPSFRGDSSFASFVFGLCIRVAKHHARTWARWSRLLDEMVQKAPLEQVDSSTEDHVLRNQRLAAVQRALLRTSFKLRTVLVLYEMEGFSGQEIAEQLGVSEKTVWTRLHNARKAFRRYYQWPPLRKKTHDARE